MTAELSRLKCKDLRDAWPHEATDFTPWLAKNIDMLSEIIGIPLESEGTEVSVDQFAADILARNTNDDSAVLIENQLDSSDHPHLGQILTYLAGLEAQTVVWIARHFEEAHLSAVRWLNENTADPFAFFAVQVKVIQINDSPLAPLFVVQEKPSRWDRQLRTISGKNRASLTEDEKHRRYKFWKHYAARHPDDGISPNDVKYSVSIFDHYVESADLYIRQSVWWTGNKLSIYLYSRKRQEWQPEELERIDYYIATLQKKDIKLDNEEWPVITHLDIDMADEANWDEAADWLHKHLHIYRQILAQSP